MLIYADVTDLVHQVDGLNILASFDGRVQRPLSLFLFDVDRFKSIDDRFGHHVGDHFIMQIGAICLQHKRKADIPDRFGSEEFLLLLRRARCGTNTAKDRGVPVFLLVLHYKCDDQRWCL
jgi:diguanylate cyclase (GGDEF)-like protein